MWRMFGPFTVQLWGAFVGAIASYHSLAAMLSGEDYEWVTWPGKVLRIALQQ
eukprot:gene22182-7198_t